MTHIRRTFARSRRRYNAAQRTTHRLPKSVGALLIAKQRGDLEKRLARDGTTLSWVEFQSGPPLIEALSARAIDFGYTGDTPPVYAQAAGVDFVYVASIPQPGLSYANARSPRPWHRAPERFTRQEDRRRKGLERA